MASFIPDTLQNDAEQNTMFHGSNIHYYELHAEGKKYKVLVNGITGDPIYYQEMKNEDLEEDEEEVEDMGSPDFDQTNGAEAEAEVEIPQWDDEDGDREWAENPWDNEERWEEYPDREEETQWENERWWWYERFLAEQVRWENRRWREMIAEDQEEYALFWVYPEEWYLWKRSHRRYGCRYFFFRLLLYH
ncbi:hypothetical protein OCU04_009950 [Sclerotinia nivalis]|uniref:Uncharacterized protein n=1 Tax=Sclerotinia nivalis TaxID=352851 RepID=A0A9X0AH60_9HELO|nr:hypothetical protein OCU04_009950 [Sclerotinia nivalis]